MTAGRMRAGARVRIAAVALAGLLAAAALAFVASENSGAKLPSRPERQKPELLLLTSLPIVFGEEFGLEGGGSPALAALESRYRVKVIGVADAASLKKHALLLMAQPRAQPAEVLVELDRWVRQGGRVLLLADPQLAWPSARPLGDPLRPPMMFADTGLLRHWGLRLDTPEQGGAETVRAGDHYLETVSPGSLHGRCPREAEGLLAVCKVGRGHARIVADADFLQPELTKAADSAGAQFLLRQLLALE